MAVRFGIGAKGEFAPPRWTAFVRRVEEAGFDSLWVADERLYRDVYATLAQAALASRRLQLGTAVTNPYVRPPALTAAAIATVDELSGGRTVLGLAAGGSATGALGIERRRPVRALREAITIVRGLTAGQRVELAGEVFTFAGQLDFTPLRPVPIWLAARGPRLLELGGEIADGVIIGGFASAAGLRFAQARIAAGARRAGRRGPVPCAAWIYAAAHEAEEAAQDAVRFIVALSIVASRPVLEEIGVRLPERLAAYLTAHNFSLSREVVAGAGPLLPAELIAQFSVAGTPATCRRRLAELAAAGLDEIALLVHPVRGQSSEEAVDVWRRIVDEVRR
jgi:5,10-methylenetetrahydromethanopterin reductase